MKLVLMGTGTSHGVPVIGCSCKVCRSSDKKDRRYRASAFLCEPQKILIDVGPEFRLQAIETGIDSLDAVLLTHSHADHLHGIDDLRIFSHTKAVDPSKDDMGKGYETKGSGLCIYGNPRSVRDIRHRFDYIFTPVKEGGGKPKLCMVENDAFTVEHPLCIGNVEVLPVLLWHGSFEDSGYILRHGDSVIAYLTDVSSIPEKTFEQIKAFAPKVDHLVIDALRVKVHSTHFSFDQALEAAQRIGASHTWFTHLTHQMSHVEVQNYIDTNLWKFPALEKIVEDGGSVQPAYDGLVLEC